MKRRFFVTDIHGGALALKQCFLRSGFNSNEDELYIGGDTCDGWVDTKECVNILLSVKNYVNILGNHDLWFRDYINANCSIISASAVWLNHGGYATIESYKDGIPETHKKFFNDAKPYHVTEDNKLFIHAGFKPGSPLDPKKYIYYTMNRDLVNSAIATLNTNKIFNIPEFKEVFVGHTPTTSFINQAKPIQAGNLFMLDTAAAFAGVVTIMNIDTKEYWQSDPVMILYPNHKGRNEKSYNDFLKRR